MNQHPVPQNISSYEFKLVGDMTLKQFFQLAGGAVLSLMIYASSLPGIIKWPLILFFTLLGTALAFLPFEERPLTTWIASFFKAIYSPTMYNWQKGAGEDVFGKESVGSLPIPLQQIAPKPEGSGVLSTFEEAEKTFFRRVMEMFQVVPGHSQVQQIQTAQPARVMSTPTESVPFAAPVRVGPIEKPIAPPLVRPLYAPQSVSPVFEQKKPETSSVQAATFTPEAAPPNPPAVANTVVGQVLTQDGKIVEGAILEIRDQEQRPVRAIKTNKVGHFLTVTPLKDGSYEIETEKEGLVFDKVRVSLEGRIVPPVLIRAKTGNS